MTDGGHKTPYSGLHRLKMQWRLPLLCVRLGAPYPLIRRLRAPVYCKEVEMPSSRLSINSRLGLSMAFLGLLLIAIGVAGLVGMSESNGANRRMYAEQLPKSIAIGEMTILVGRQRTTLDRAAVNPGSDDARQMYVTLKDVRRAADQAWAQYIAMPARTVSPCR